MAAVAGTDTSMLGTAGIDTAWLEEGKGMAECAAIGQRQELAQLSAAQEEAKKEHASVIGKQQEEIDGLRGYVEELVVLNAASTAKAQVQAKENTTLIATHTSHLNMQGNVIVKMKAEIAGLRGDVQELLQTFRAAQEDTAKEQQEQKALAKQVGTQDHARHANWNRAIAVQANQVNFLISEMSGLQRIAQALTRVFSWSTDTAWTDQSSSPYTFTDGVRGRCYNSESAGGNFAGFTLEEGPVCTLHFSCAILDTEDKVLRVLTHPDVSDYHKPPLATAPIGQGTGTFFEATPADQAGAVRADGSIKLRMVVDLYLPV